MGFIDSMRAGRGAAVDLQDLKEEAVQVKRVIQLRVVDHVPDLEFTGADRFRVVVHLPIDRKVDAVPKAALATEMNGAIGHRIRRGERFNPAQSGWDVGARRTTRSDFDGGVRCWVFLDHSPGIGEGFQPEVHPGCKRSDDEVGTVGRSQQHLCGDNGRLEQAAVSSDDPELPAAERQADVARAGCIDDTPAFDLPACDMDSGVGPPVEKPDRSTPAIVALHPPAGSREATAAIELDVV